MAALTWIDQPWSRATSITWDDDQPARRCINNGRLILPEPLA
jgi:hypothetical protein